MNDTVSPRLARGVLPTRAIGRRGSTWRGTLCGAGKHDGPADGLLHATLQALDGDDWTPRALRVGQVAAAQLLAIVLRTLRGDAPSSADSVIVAAWAAELYAAARDGGELVPCDAVTALPLPALPDGW